MYEDKELQEYRDLLQTPTHFEEGFDWKTIVGAIFIGFLMMPGSMYLQLVIGTGIGPAARWVTIILFAEIAKRSYTELKQQEIFLLYYMAGAALASPFQGLLWNQYLVGPGTQVMTPDLRIELFDGFEIHINGPGQNLQADILIKI